MAKPFLLWENIFEDGTITSSSEASGWPDDAVIDWFGLHDTSSRWQAGGTTTPQWVKVDLGAGNTASPDTVVIGGHNLSTIGGTVVVQYSSDDFSADTNNAFTAVTPSNDKVICRTWTATAARYWRVYLTHGSAFTAAPQIGLITLGRRFDFSVGWQPNWDPYDYEPKVSRSKNKYGGALGGNLRHYTKRFSINYRAPGLLETELNPASGLTFDGDFRPHADTKPFWYAWDIDTEDQHVWLCERTSPIETPFHVSTTRRTLKIDCETTIED